MDLSISVFDAITVTEFVGYFDDSLRVSEDVTVTVSIANLFEVSISDALGITESVSVTATLASISVYEWVYAADQTGYNNPNITYGDSGATYNQAGTTFVTVEVVSLASVVDTLTVLDLIISSEQVFHASVDDSLAVAEDTVSELVSLVNVNDALTITEDVEEHLSSSLDLYDTLSIEESVTLHLLSAISVADDLSVIDSPAVERIMLASVFDTLSITEGVTTDSVRFSPQTPMTRPRGSSSIVSPRGFAGMTKGPTGFTK